ncbi:hypothetical protein [Maribacter sp. ACAM166]|uniref:hypothetical protein n=1 Tax=Maribacter sp. ACAM166 TaxID=2508996 RepID=UPI0010FF36E0|nr:hypothetical protein [Maribacter sp. ACAM166]TLP71888.1 hypothetical protein ES765_19050 [Maribacter sp. ACAM166]
MIDGFSFVNKESLLPILIGGLIVFGCYFWKESTNRKHGKFIINTIVAFLTITALVLIVLKPTKEVEINDRQGLLLTEGFDEQQKDSLLLRYQGIKELNYNPNKSIGYKLDSLTGLFVLGNGIKPFDFELFKNIPLTYITAKEPYGITDFRYKKSIVLGEKLNVKGIYNKPLKGTMLILEDAGGNGLDSVQLDRIGEVGFSLEAVPKVSGEYVYLLTEKDSVGVKLKSEPIPVVIKEKEPLRVLILNNFPTFETKYLKNFLADNGHEVIVRSQLTKGKYKFEYFNTATTPVYQFTDEILNKFDIVIVDSDIYFGFGSMLKKRFEKSIRESGMGLFIQPSGFLFNLGTDTSYFKFERDSNHEVHFETFKIKLEKYPYGFKGPFSFQPIAFGTTTTVAAYKQLGLGRIATTTVQNSYQLLLDGEGEGYKWMWTKLFDKISKKKNTSVEWEAETQVPRIDAPFDFKLRTNLEEYTVLNENDDSVAMLQNSMVPMRYLGTVYPKKIGWNHLKIETDSSSQFPFYVFDSLVWKSLTSSKTIAANQKEFKSGLKHNRAVFVDRSISPILFYLLFLVGIGWLWLAPKLSTDK